MKKILYFALCLPVILSLVSCTGEKKESPATPKETAASEEKVMEEQIKETAEKATEKAKEVATEEETKEKTKEETKEDTTSEEKAKKAKEDSSK